MKICRLTRGLICVFARLPNGFALAAVFDTPTTGEAATRQLTEQRSNTAGNKAVAALLGFSAPAASPTAVHAPATTVPASLGAFGRLLWRCPGPPGSGWEPPATKSLGCAPLTWPALYLVTSAPAASRRVTRRPRGKSVVMRKKQSGGEWKVLYEIFEAHS